MKRLILEAIAKHDPSMNVLVVFRTVAEVESFVSLTGFTQWTGYTYRSHLVSYNDTVSGNRGAISEVMVRHMLAKGIFRKPLLLVTVGSMHPTTSEYFSKYPNVSIEELSHD